MPVKIIAALIFLVNHGFMLETPAKRAALTDVIIKDVTVKLEKAGVQHDRPVALWLESSAPARLSFSLVDPQQFYDKLSEESELDVDRIQTLLRQPEWGKDADSQKLRSTLEALYKGDQKQAPPAAAAMIKAGEDHLEKQMPEDVMTDRIQSWAAESKKYHFLGYKVEKAPVEGWITNLRARLWEYSSYEAFQTRKMDDALKYALREHVLLKKSFVLRDKKLAKDIAKWHKKHPNVLNVVIRGAAHEDLAPGLAKLGIQNEVVRETPISEVMSVADIYGPDYKPSDKLFDNAYALTPLERRVMTRAFLERLCWSHLISAEKKDFSIQLSKDLARAIRGLSDAKLEEWLTMMQHEPAELPIEKDASLSWSWFAKISGWNPSPTSS